MFDFTKLFNAGARSHVRSRMTFTVKAFTISALYSFFILCSSAFAVMDLADAPLFTRIQPPPADIMIVLDDSGSMSFEVLVKGQYDGQYPNPNHSDPTEGFCFLFENLGDGVYSEDWRYMTEEDRKYWQSQWYGANVMYYNPNLTYTPWPGTAKHTFSDADPAFPRPHPVIDTGKTLDLHAKSFEINGQLVDHAHYYVQYEGVAYLVELENLVNDIVYFEVGVTGSGLAEKVASLSEISPFDGIRPKRKACGSDPETEEFCSYEEELQNFANWYTYYRRREYTAKAALARVISKIDNVRIGIYGINERIIIPLLPVKATIEEALVDKSENLLNALYEFQSRGGTPLKQGVQTVGEYYKNNSKKLAGVSGDVPFPVDGGACQQVFTIVMTDGFYSDTGFNAKANGADNDDGEPYADSFDDTLADIAMYYYENDLSDYDDLVPTNKFDDAFHQHMVTYGVAFGVVGTLDPKDYWLDPTDPDTYMKHKTTDQYIVWPKVTGVRIPESIDDLWHASVNGRGEFLNAADPQELIDALQTLMDSISKRTEGSVASVTVNGESLYAVISDELLVFQSSYSNLDDEWIGDVQAFHIDTDTGEVLTDEWIWSAAETLSKRTATRKILSYHRSNASGIVFSADELSEEQQEDLGADYADVVEYIKEQKLRDIVHSSPAFENNVVYVGANDGMLHAFDVLNEGYELFAYVPDLVYQNLAALADPDYIHNYYVDLTPTLKKGQGILGDGGVTATLLVGGLGKGGRGYFALDVSEPQSMDKNDVKWEFPNMATAAEHVADMGYSFSKPVIVRSNLDDPLNWIVIIGNGYDSPGSTEEGIPAGRSVLFILNPANGAVLKKIVADSGEDNGMSTPIAIDVNLDGKVDFVYAGDLKGNLWKFDLTGTSIASWGVAHKEGIIPQPLFVARGSEADPDEAIQSITIKPDVMQHPTQPGYLVCFASGKFLGESDFNDFSVQSVYGIWDYGDKVYRLNAGWTDDDDREYLGRFISRDVDPETKQLSNQVKFVKMLKQQVTDLTVDIDGKDVEVRILSDEEPDWITVPDSSADQLPDPSNEELNHAGWYFDLTEGERVVSDVLIRGGRLIVIGFIPDDARCAHGGDSYFMEVNASTGGRLDSAVFDINEDGSVGGGSVDDPGDYINIGTPEDPVWVPPSGKKIPGQLQTPIILGFPKPRPDCDEPPCPPPPCDNPPCPSPPPPQCLEVKISSSSSGDMVEIKETCAAAGMLYWKQVQYE